MVFQLFVEKQFLCHMVASDARKIVKLSSDGRICHEWHIWSVYASRDRPFLTHCVPVSIRVALRGTRLQRPSMTERIFNIMIVSIVIYVQGEGCGSAFWPTL